MTGNHWTVFNSAGAVICDNMPLDVVHAYMTPERFERGWTAVYCFVVRREEDLPATERAATKPPKCDRCGGEGVIDQTGYGEYRPCPECNEDGSRPVYIR